MAKLTSAQKAAKTRAANTKARAVTSRAEQMSTRQQEFATGSGAARMTSPVTPIGSEKLADTYHRLGYRDDAIHPAGQQELPGMTSLNEARASGLMPPRVKGKTDTGGLTIPDKPTPIPKWEELTDSQRATTIKGMAAHGATPETMKQSFGAQVDQSYTRAARHGKEPHAMRFYSDRSDSPEGEPMKPAEKLRHSAHANHVSLATQVVADAMTSPKQVFMHTPKSGPNKGTTTYPNDRMANIAVQGAQRMLDDPNFHHTDITHPPGVSGMYGNTRRAGYAVHQHLTGTDINELTGPPIKTGKGTPIFGPKTRTYFNARVDPHSSDQRLTADIHTGGGGMLPHLSGDSPTRYRNNRTGKRVWVESGAEPPKGHTQERKAVEGARGSVPVWGKHEKEKALDVPFVHSLMDHVARQVMAERGLQSVSGMQAAQWGEERIHRGLESEAQAFPRTRPHTHEVHGQEALF